MSTEITPARRSPTSTAGTGGRPAHPGTPDFVLLHDGIYRLPVSPEPQVVFGGVADLLATAICDEAVADVLIGARLARWQQNPPELDGIPVRRRLPDGSDDGHTVTVHIGGLPAEADEWTGDLDYMVALTCGWRSQDEPSESTVAVIKIVARHGAAIVHQAQQAELIIAQGKRIRHLEDR